MVRRNDAHVELYIDRGKDSEKENTTLFEEFLSCREGIESDFGGALEWQRLEGKRACRIKYAIDVGGYANEETWPQTHDEMVSAMIRLHEALRSHIDRIK